MNDIFWEYRNTMEDLPLHVRKIIDCHQLLSDADLVISNHGLECWG